jgi:membrane protein DedA with SNARE-associated domain
VLVATAGGFAAAGDLTLWHVALGAFVGFCIGDQLAFFLARSKGPWIMGKLKASASRAKLITRAEGFLKRNGILAVLMSRTILSPLGPYVTYISGAVGLSWAKFTGSAILGAALWSGAYSYLGYVFAGNLSQISSALGNILGFIAAAGVLVGSGYWLFRKPSSDLKKPMQTTKQENKNT